MALSKQLLGQAITKGLNKSHGKTVVEQTSAVLDMIEKFEDIFDDGGIEVVKSPDIGHQVVTIQAQGDPVRDGSPIIVSSSPVELPSRLGSGIVVEKPIDGLNYRTPAIINKALSELPETISIEINDQVLTCRRFFASEAASDKAECIALRYVPDILSSLDKSHCPAVKFWTTDHKFDPIKKFEEVSAATIDFLKKHPSFRTAPIHIVAMPAPQANGMVEASKFSDEDMKKIPDFADRWASTLTNNGTQSIFSQFK